MSMFMACLARELRETGELKGLGGMAAASLKNAAREYEAKLEQDRQRPILPTPKEGADHG